MVKKYSNKGNGGRSKIEGGLRSKKEKIDPNPSGRTVAMETGKVKEHNSKRKSY